MWHFLYNALLILAAPAILVVLLAKQRCRRGLTQRFGFRPPSVEPDGRPLLWLHAVSLGEVVAVAPLVKELSGRLPGYRFVVSTVTETGREAVEQRLAGLAEHFYAPLDFPWAVSRTIDRLNPRLYAFVETELWPNLLRQLSLRGVPTVMVNGRLSSRSYARQEQEPVRSFYRTMVRSISLCLMQSDRDVERIISLGADRRSVRRTGNIKFDQPPPTASGGGELRRRMGIPDKAGLIVAGSTHAGEEEMVVGAYQQVLARHPSTYLLLAPRHIERAEVVEAMVRGRGLSVRRRSRVESDHAAANQASGVTILDTRGELASVYREAQVSFVGGTLVPVGGHNLLEPAVWSKPVLFGPYTDHCAEIAEWLVQSGGGRRVTGTEDLTAELVRLFDHPEDGVAMGRAAHAVVRQNQGALRLTADALALLLEGRSPQGIPTAVPAHGGALTELC